MMVNPQVIALWGCSVRAGRGDDVREAEHMIGKLAVRKMIFVTEVKNWLATPSGRPNVTAGR
jgi:hypothetical protein